MKKAIKLVLSYGLAFTLLSGAITTLANKNIITAYAEEHIHETETFLPWNDPISLPESGKYYLTVDVELAATWKPEHETWLCLHGHGITMTGEGSVIEVKRGGTLRIFDDSDTVHKYRIDDKTGLGIVNDSLTSDYETFTGGYITGGNDKEGHGGGIYLPGGTKNGDCTTLYFLGGTLIGNHTTGNGGAICYNYASKMNSVMDIADCNIIGNVADGMAGAIYHQANNRSLQLRGKVNISKNVSGSRPAGILEHSILYIQDDLYVYDNHLKDGTPSDITVSHDTQNNKVINLEALSDNTKIGFDEIKCGYIQNYYDYNSKNPNEVFVSHNSDLFKKDPDSNNVVYNKVTSYGMEGPADGYNYSIQVHIQDTSYPYTILYGTKEGEYTTDVNPTFNTPGIYNVYYQITMGVNAVTGFNTVTVYKYDPVIDHYPEAIEGLVYIGEEQTLIKPGKMGEGGTLQYRLGEDGEWSINAPKAKNAQTYNVYYRVVGDEDYKDIDPVLIEVTIAENDKTALINKITDATNYYNQIKDDYDVVASSLNDAIKTATDIKDNPNVLVSEISGAVSSLDAAIGAAQNECAEVDNVNALISAIGEVTLESETAINNARKAYNALNDDLKSLTKLSVLEEAETKLADLKKAHEVELLIDDIGEVKYPDSVEKVNKAKEAYNALSETQKALVDSEHKTTLETAIATLKDLEDHAKAEEAISLIDAIGTVTYPDSKEAIDAAVNAYDALTDAQKALVDDEHKTILNNAVILYEALENQALASEVIDLINKIGNIDDSEECRNRIRAARNAYEILTDAQKALVTNYQTLVDAEITYQKLMDKKLILPIVLGSVGGFIFLLGLTYVLMFFVFNKWIKEDDKFLRVVRFGKKEDKVRLMKMSFRFIYKDEGEILNSNK